jgi:hypothetical protein
MLGPSAGIAAFSGRLSTVIAMQSFVAGVEADLD